MQYENRIDRLNSLPLYDLFPRFACHEILRIRNLIRDGINLGDRLYTVEEYGREQALDITIDETRKWLDEFTLPVYTYTNVDCWLEKGSEQWIREKYRPLADFSLCYKQRPEDPLLVRKDCRRLILPEEHTIASTGWRPTSFGRQNDVHLYGNPFGTGVGSPVGKTERDILRFQFCKDENFLKGVNRAGALQYDISHLCHNNWCHNWRHVILEWDEVNKGRNGCLGGPCCGHRHQCPIPGAYSLM